MKKLTCEMCGGNDLIKKDGMYVCETCGTKYSVEEAKKMMIEGVVDVSGSTVSVDSLASAENYYKMAESEYELNKYKETIDYCNKVIAIEFNNHKAWLLKGKASRLKHDDVKEYMDCFIKALDFASEDDKELVKTEASKFLEDTTLKLLEKRCSDIEAPLHADTLYHDDTLNEINDTKTIIQLFLDKYDISVNDFRNKVSKMLIDVSVKRWDKIYSKISEGQYLQYEPTFPGSTLYENEFGTIVEKSSGGVYGGWNNYIKTADFSLVILNNVLDLVDDNELRILTYTSLINIDNGIINTVYSTGFSSSEKHWLSIEAKEYRINKIMSWHAKIKEIDENYVIPERPKAEKPEIESGGCYVATVVYGSYDCPEVWTLRRFRDYSLASTWYGRLFIRMYYTLSPSLVKWFGDTYWFKRLWRGKLDKLVQSLQEQGYESTPYKDSIW